MGLCRDSKIYRIRINGKQARKKEFFLRMKVIVLVLEKSL